MDVFGSLSRRNLKENSNSWIFVTLFSERSLRLWSVIVTSWVVVMLSKTVTSKTLSFRFSMEIELLVICLFRLLILHGSYDRNLGSENPSFEYQSFVPWRRTSNRIYILNKWCEIGTQDVQWNSCFYPWKLKLKDKRLGLSKVMHWITRLPWRGGRVVECGGLENRCTCKRTEGSNPSLSAIPRHESKIVNALAHEMLMIS